ncbi:MAG TPA: spore maturation protein [Clostridia bacterium]|nr:spore maturation protein [Clostridia bacterium]
MNIIWAFMIIISILFGIFGGKMSDLSGSLMSSAQDAVKLCFSICGAYVFWTGLLRVAQKSGLVNKLAKVLRIALKRLFPNSADDPLVMGSIAMNLGADMLGLGNAATPFGVEAVKRMAKLSKGKSNDDIKMFLVLNAATLQFFPTTVIAMRMASNASEPSDIILGTVLCSGVSMAVGILSAIVFARVRRKKE